MADKISSETKAKLGVLWVLLNCSTELKYSAAKAVDIMNAIEKYCPEARRMWNTRFQIVVNGKTVFEWPGA